MAPLSKARSRRLGRLHRRRTREREGLVLVEGPRAVREARGALADPASPLALAAGPGRAPWYVVAPRLAEVDPRQERIVQMRFFAGLTQEEIADVLDISLSTVKREWRTARLFLLREIYRVFELGFELLQP